MSIVVTGLDTAVDLQDEQYTSPVGGQNPGFFAWLSANYSDLAVAGQSIACMIDPRRCSGGINTNGETLVVKDDSSKMYFWILGVFMLIILVVVLIKK